MLRVIKIVGFIVIGLAATFSVGAASAGQTIDAFGLIADAAGRICRTPSDSANKSISSSALKDQISNLLEQLAGLGLPKSETFFSDGRAAELQDKLSQIAPNAPNCHIKAFRLLRESLMASAESTGQPPPEEGSFSRPSGIEDSPQTNSRPRELTPPRQ
jgi:hypothetical protein